MWLLLSNTGLSLLKFLWDLISFFHDSYANDSAFYNCNIYFIAHFLILPTVEFVVGSHFSYKLQDAFGEKKENALVQS